MRSWSFSRRLPLRSRRRMEGSVLEVMIEGKVADENAYVGRTYMDSPGRGRAVSL